MHNSLTRPLSFRNSLNHATVYLLNSVSLTRKHSCLLNRVIISYRTHRSSNGGMTTFTSYQCSFWEGGGGFDTQERRLLIFFLAISLSFPKPNKIFPLVDIFSTRVVRTNVSLHHLLNGAETLHKNTKTEQTKNTHRPPPQGIQWSALTVDHKPNHYLRR